MGYILFLISAMVIVAIFAMIGKKSAESKDITADQTTTPANTQKTDTGNKSGIYNNIKITVPDGYEVMEIQIAGCNYRRGLEDFVGEFDGHLVAEPNNNYDSEAIAIKIGRKKLGYVPEAETDDVRRFTGGKLPFDCHGILARGYDRYNDREYYYGIAVIVKPKL